MAAAGGVHDEPVRVGRGVISAGKRRKKRRTSPMGRCRWGGRDNPNLVLAVPLGLSLAYPISMVLFLSCFELSFFCFFFLIPIFLFLLFPS